MSEEDNQEIPMAQCDACNAIVPLDSESCAQCGAIFSGISDDALGECGQCGSIIPIDSVSCQDCGAFFVDLNQTKEETRPQRSRKPPSSKTTTGVDFGSAIESQSAQESTQPVGDDLEAAETVGDDEQTEELEADIDNTISHIDDVNEIDSSEVEEIITEDVVTEDANDIVTDSETDDIKFATEMEVEQENESVIETDEDTESDDLDQVSTDESSVDEIIETDEEEVQNEIEQAETQEHLDEEEMDSSEDAQSETEEMDEDVIAEQEIEDEEYAQEEIEESKTDDEISVISQEGDDHSENEDIESEKDDIDDSSVVNEMDDEEAIETEEDSDDETEEDTDSIDSLIDNLNEEDTELDSEDSDSDTDSLDDNVETEAEVEEEEAIDNTIVVMAFENLALAIAGEGMTAGEAFGEMDSSDDGLIDAPELQKGIQKIAGEKLSPKQVTAILNYLDKDGNKRIDPSELLKALDDLRIGIQPGNIPRAKTFPSPVQKFLMGKKANDVLYPVAYFLMATFIGLWVVNGMGLLVDGTGGTVIYEGGTDQWGGEIREANWNLCESDALDEMIDPCQGTVAVGEPYPCDPSLDPNKCENSLTPFSGDNGASSMPYGFYKDGIVMIVLGVLGLAATAYLHLIYAPGLRTRARKAAGKEDEDTQSADEEDTDKTEDDEEVDDDQEEFDEEDDQFEEDDEIEDDHDDDIEDDDDEDGGIDIGDWVGLEIDGEEYFGEIIEFDDEEETVTIETEDGEEVTGYQDEMFLEEDDE